MESKINKRSDINMNNINMNDIIAIIILVSQLIALAFFIFVLLGGMD